MRPLFCRAALIAVLSAFATVSLARLPPPTPDEAKAKKAAAAEKGKADEAAKQALARAQDRVAARYKARHKH